MKNKRGEESAIGFGTIVTWAIIIGVGIVLLVLMLKSSGAGRDAFNNIKGVFSFG